MNLHIVPDSSFVNKFYENLQELGLLHQNQIVVRTNNSNLKSIKHNLPFAALYSSKFNTLVGDTLAYQSVFIHYFTPLLYRWVSTHEFKDLNWLVWGGDLYNLPSLDRYCYEPITWKWQVRQTWSIERAVYSLKVILLNGIYKKKAYSKINAILTWMTEEYKYAKDHLSVEAGHKFFFYENQVGYEGIEKQLSEITVAKRERPLLIIGNSGSPTNNHLDLIQDLEKQKIETDLAIPVTYGDAKYIQYLKKTITYGYGSVHFLEKHLAFDEYIAFLASANGLVMNTIRPQGYGNVLMMMYLNKPVFFNSKNISLADLTAAGIQWHSTGEIKSLLEIKGVENRSAVVKLLSHERLRETYLELFGAV